MLTFPLLRTATVVALLGLFAAAGCGDPKARPPELVAEDIREGYVSEEQARKLYGYRGGSK